MSRKGNGKSRQDLPQEPPGVSEPEGDAFEDVGTATEPGAPEQPAQVELKIKGSDRSARAAAKRFGGEPPSPVLETPGNDPEPPGEDPVSMLLSDGRNMVLVTRQKPRTVEAPNGQEVPTNVRIPGSYTCPTSKAEIEELVFAQHGGSKYKCTIHPDTSEGANKILGHFTIEHSDPKCPPFIDGVTINLPEPDPEIPTGGDPTLRETDNLVEVKARLQRRLDRAETMKEIKQMEKLTRDAERDLENDGRPPAPIAPVGESEEVKKLREENAKLTAALSEKKVNDRFDKLETSIAALAQSVTALATAKPAVKEGEDAFTKFLLKKMDSDDVRFGDLTKALTAKQAPVAAPPAEDFDKMLDRFGKMKTTFGSKDSRVSELEDKLIDASIDRLMDNGDGAPAEEEDAFKFALKQMTPVLKSYVEKKVGQKEEETGEPATKEDLKKAYEDAGRKAAQEIAEKWQREGLVVRAPIDPATGRPALPAAGKKGIPPRHVKPGDRPGTVTSVRETAQGRVKTVHVEPADLSEKAKTSAGTAIAEAPPSSAAEPKKEDVSVKYTTLPGLGEGGAPLKVELPAQPGDMRYDRKYAVNFVLDSVRSEILQGMPTKSPDESVVVGDALELLDDEILGEISKVETGDDLEKALGPWSDPAKIAAIKEAGSKDEATKSWLRRIFITISDNFKDYKRQGI
jgi:hypothetical protein